MLMNNHQEKIKLVIIPKEFYSILKSFFVDDNLRQMEDVDKYHYSKLEAYLKILMND